MVLGNAYMTRDAEICSPREYSIFLASSTLTDERYVKVCSSTSRYTPVFLAKEDLDVALGRAYTTWNLVLSTRI